MISALDQLRTVTFFSDRAARTKREEHLSLRTLAARVRETRAARKDDLPWLKLAAFGETPSPKGSLRYDANILLIHGVEADYDGETMTPADAVGRLTAARLAAVVYTSPSHTAAKPRWRVLCPTSDWLLPETRRELTGRLNGVLGGSLSLESFTLSQGYYYGCVGENPDHSAWLVDGRCIDDAQDLTYGALYPRPVVAIAAPEIPAGLPAAEHVRAALTAAASMFTAPDVPGQIHRILLGAANALAPMIRSGHLTADVAESHICDGMQVAGRAPNDGEIESALAWAVARAAPYEPPTYGAEFDVIAAAPLPQAKRTMRDRFVFPADCETGPRRGYIIKHLIAPGDVGALIGPPSTGKSMLAPYLAFAVAQGREVFGLRTKPGRTLYVAAEDATGMRQRVHALKLQHGDAPDFAMVDCGNLRDPATAADLCAAVADWQPVLVVVDTLGAAFAGLDENSSQDMGQVVELARGLARLRCAVLLIHHTAKQGDGTPRGHSVLNGTLDMSLRLEPKDDAGVIRGVLGKNRNGTNDLDLAFRYVAVDLGNDEDGDLITAPMALEIAAGASGIARPRLSPTERRALAILESFENAEGGVPEGEWRAACVDQAISTSEDPKNRGKVVAKIIKALLDKGWVAAQGGAFCPRAPACDGTTRNRQEPAGTKRNQLEPVQLEPGTNGTTTLRVVPGSGSDPHRLTEPLAQRDELHPVTPNENMAT